MQTYWDTQSRQSPTIQAKVYRALLHQDSITYRRMQMYWAYPEQMDPPANQA